MAQMHSPKKKVHQYAHHTYQHLDALMKEVIIPEDLEKLGLQYLNLLPYGPQDSFGAATPLLW